MNLRLIILFAALVALTLPTAAQRSIVNRTVVDRSHVTGRTYVNRSPKKIIPVSDNPSLLEGRGISATGAPSDAAALREAVTVQDITGNNLAVASFFPFGEAFSLFTSGGGGGGIVKPPPGATINPTDGLAQGLAGLWLYNEGGSATSITEYVSGTQSATSPSMVWGTLPAQTGLPLAGPYVDNITPATRATAVFLQSPTVLKDNLFQGGYLGGATWVHCFKPADGVNPAYVADNSAQSPPNPTSGGQAYGFLTYINFPGNGGWIGETIYDANGTNLTSTGPITGKLFQFNTSTLPWIFMVCVMPPGISQGLYVYANLDGSGNPIDHLRLMKIVSNADCAHTMASSSPVHNATGPIYGLNMLGVWGTAGPVGAKEAMAYAAIWNRPLTVTGAVNVGDSVTGGEVFDEFAAPCRMTTNSGIGNATITASDSASFGDGLAVNGTASLSPAETASVSETFAVDTGQQTTGAHPRLLVTQTDVATMKAWTGAGNVWWTDIANVLVPQVKNLITAGTLPGGDTGLDTSPYPVEKYALILAFASLLDPNPVTAADDALKAHDLVMHAINIAKLGDLTTNPRAAFRDPDFMTSDRMRWSGMAFPFIYDWCFSTFSSQERLDCVSCFARWANNCKTRGYAADGASYPTPVNTLASSVLTNSSYKRRWSANNYYQGRTMITGLLANAVDPADDPGNILIGPYNDTFWKAWLYVRDAAESNAADYAGSITPEGMEYGINGFGTIAFVVELLNHAGLADRVKYGSLVDLLQKPQWQNYPAAYVSQLSPNTAVRIPNSLGPSYYPAEYGDTQTYQTVEPVLALAALGRYNTEHGLGPGMLDACRWIIYNMHDYGPTQWRKIQRDSFSASQPINVVLHFMMFDPTAAFPTGSADPRPTYPLDFASPSLTRILTRTDWGPNATWVVFHAPWNLINHQATQCGKVEFYRKGEWLSCGRPGYGVWHDCSDNGNTLSLQTRFRSGMDYHYAANGNHGSQWTEVSDGVTPTNVYSLTPSYIYMQTDMAGLYRSTYATATDVTQANRSVMWLRGDYILVYDRAKSSQPNQFKRQEWTTVTMPTISGNVATATNASGQHLYITSVLPAGTNLFPYDPHNSANYPAGDIAINGGLGGEQENGTPMHYRVRIEDLTNPQTIRFLTVLQGADSGVVTPGATGSFASSAGTPFDGVTINPGNGLIAALFIQDPSVAFAGTTFTIPAGATKVYVTGLSASSGYTVTNVAGVVTIASGGSTQTDSGGVLTVTP